MVIKNKKGDTIMCPLFYLIIYDKTKDDYRGLGIG